MCLVPFFLLCVTSSVIASTYYVDASRPDDAGDGLTWATAKQTIQEAVDLAVDTDVVLVTNGVYNKGCRITPGYALSNRVVITKNITVQSINGPEVTIIEGVGPLGDAAVRCVFMTNACLSGFTLTNGYTCASGDAHRDRSGGGCYAVGSILSNCVIEGNMASYKGGGVCKGTLDSCVIRNNNAEKYGGGVSDATITGSHLSNNHAGQYGGGVDSSSINNSIIKDNSAGLYGGGASGSTIHNCSVLGNSAISGGGTYFCDHNNCTIINNYAEQVGGGVFNNMGIGTCSVNNCIVYYNEAAVTGANYYIQNPLYVDLNYSCTVPMPEWGICNITNQPLLTDNYHIGALSPCVGMGFSSLTFGYDIDGDQWAVDPSIGCDEPVFSSATGPLLVEILTDYTHVRKSIAIDLRADIEGHASSNLWDFGDGTKIVDTLFPSHSWTITGEVDVVLTAYNISNPGGVSATQTITVLAYDQPTGFVSANSPSPAPPYTNWLTAAHTVQDAINAADPAIAGHLILVTNGVYDDGGQETPGAGLTNRICLTNAYMMLMSVNGPSVTHIKGSKGFGGTYGPDAVRCVYIDAEKSCISGFTLTNGCTSTSGVVSLDTSGGGVLSLDSSSVLSNSVISGNSAFYGGGASGSRLVNCVISGNNASNVAGGLFQCSLYDCIIADNGAYDGAASAESSMDHCVVFKNVAFYSGGGSYYDTLNNSIIFENSAAYFGGGSHGSTLNNCIVYNNDAQHFGGGSYYSTLNNCILWDNTSFGSDASNHYQCTINYSCTLPSPTNGNGNIDADPLFVDVADSNFHLQVFSPCIDAGQNEAWMDDSTDFDGNARIINGRVDMGAYEFHFDTDVRAMLQGPYTTNTHHMAVALTNSIPSTSLYADDPRTVTNIPDDTVDWILLQARPSLSNAPTFSRSYFLKSDGSVISASGDTNLLIEVDPGTTNYLVVAHRNHPAVMSAEPIVFANQSISYDFTLNSNQYYGADSGAVELEPGVWGLMAGDADGDGWVSWVDQSICTMLVDHVGYQCGDYDLDGVVTTNDLDLCMANADRMAAFPNAEIAFSPALAVIPARKTVVAEDSLLLTASGSTNAITWFGVMTESGGDISSVTSTTALYQAGSTSEVVDVIQAWDGDYRFGRSYMNIIDSSAVSSYGKAVVLAGRVSPSDPLWEATDYLAGNAFNTLLYRGLSKDTVQYLSAVTNRDVDGDGVINDIDLYTSVENATETFTNWVYDAEKLFVYFVDHGSVDGGGNAHLRLNPSETLAAARLDSWLDTFQDKQQKEVTVLIDCCYAARFMEELSYTGTAKRVVIAAAGTNEPAYYMANGLISFSDAFFSGIMSGNDVAESYDSAAAAMASYQQAGYDDNVGGSGAEGLYLGATFVAGKDVPHIGMVCGNQLLTDGSEASLWAGDVVSAYALDRVWCVVVPPTHNPTNPAQAVIDIPEVELSYNSASGRYEGNYTGFSEPGSYKIIYYARDIWNSVSAPMQSYVVQTGYDERFIIVGGGETNWVCWEAINNLANYTYSAMQRRGMDAEHIYYLSAWTNQDVDLDGSNDVSASATLANLGNAITNWALEADMLSVYLIGAGSNDLYYVNESETLDAVTLDGWLDKLQLTNEYAINVVMDFSASGSWIPILIPPENKPRVCIASAKEDREAVMDAEGMLSFTRFFVSDISAGASIGQAYRSAQYSMRRASGAQRQNARIDDNGNGIPNEKNVDGVSSASVFMGPAFVTGNELPSIGSVPEDQELTNTTSFSLWAADVTDADGITNVWCLVSPPSTGWDTNSVSVSLVWNSENDRYEGIYSDVMSTGIYTCTYFSQNTNGVISIPLQSMVQIMQHIVVGPDLYEPDDRSVEATVFTMGLTQEHTIHVSNDVDWVFFTAYSNFLYDIETVHGTNQIDTVLTLYRRETNGLLTQIDTIDEFGYDQGEIMGLDHPALGLYYINVHAVGFLEVGSYSLTITPTPSGGISDKLIITVMNLLNGQPIPGGITARLHTGSEQSLGGNDQTIFYGLADGDYTVSLNNVPDGWPHRTMASEISVHIPKQAQSVLNADFLSVPLFLSGRRVS